MLKYYPLLVLLFCVACYSSNAQFTYKIKADSVKITNDSCTAELIIENSTKNINGFLYNKGNGRTEFRPALSSIIASNGLTKSGDTLKFGGSLTGRTIINQKKNPIYFYLNEDTLISNRNGFNIYAYRDTATSTNNLFVAHHQKGNRIEGGLGGPGSIFAETAWMSQDSFPTGHFPNFTSVQKSYAPLTIKMSSVTLIGYSSLFTSYAGQRFGKFIHFDARPLSTPNGIINEVYGINIESLKGPSTGISYAIRTAGPNDSIYNAGPVRWSKYKNNSTGDSVLTTDVDGIIKLKHPGTFTLKRIDTLTESSTINWDYQQNSRMAVVLKGNRTLSITNLVNGAEGKLIVEQDSTGMRTLALPANSYVENEGNGKAPLTQTAGAVDILSFIYTGNRLYWTVHKSYTASPKVARFNFNETAQNVPGWNDVSGNPHQAIRTAKDVATNIGVSSIATTKWGAFGSGTSSNTLGEKDANPTFVFGPQVTVSYWFSATYTYSTSADCNLEINGLESGATYNIEILASRDDVDVTNPNRYMRAICVDNAGTTYVEDFDTKGNTANLINFYNKAPDGSGKILLFIGKKNPADANHPFGYLNGLRITKL